MYIEANNIYDKIKENLHVNTSFSYLLIIFGWEEMKSQESGTMISSSTSLLSPRLSQIQKCLFRFISMRNFTD